MRLLLLTFLTMIAFAANSVLNRMALSLDGPLDATDLETGPAGFALIRLASGAAALGVLALWRSGGLRLWAPGRVTARATGVVSLALYVLGFSFAYVTLDAGLGALILFGGVQITMFAGAVWRAEPMPAARWAGTALALAGLVGLLWPVQGPAGAEQIATDPVGGLMMAVAALGWGIYSLNARRSGDPLAATAGNFILTTPLAVLVYLLWPDGVSWRGAGLAVVSGVVTSGLGYALWYEVLRRIDTSVAAVAQLSVPVLAALGGVLLLNEAATLRMMLWGGVVLLGVALSVLWPRATPAPETEPAPEPAPEPGPDPDQRTSGSNGS